MNQNKTEANKEQRPTDVASGAVLGRDWRGEPIKADEKPSDKIMVWKIEPHPNDSAFDSCIERDYVKAMDLAWGAVERVMDQADEDELMEGHVLEIKVSLAKMSLEDYEAIQAERD